MVVHRGSPTNPGTLPDGDTVGNGDRATAPHLRSRPDHGRPSNDCPPSANPYARAYASIRFDHHTPGQVCARPDLRT